MKKLNKGFKEIYQFWDDAWDLNNKHYKKGQKRLLKARTLEEAEQALNLINGSLSSLNACSKNLQQIIIAAEDSFGVEWNEIKKVFE
jgi:hypothetical protein